MGAGQENPRGHTEWLAGGGGGQTRATQPREAAKVIRDDYAETPTYAGLPHKRWRRIRVNNAIERLSCEIRRRTRVAETFPDGKSALMLVTARLKHVAESEWGSRRYLDVTPLER